MRYLLGLASAGLLASAQQPLLVTDPGVYGPPLELVHTYYDEWPTGITVSKNGRMFSNYPGGLDPTNVNNGSNGVYTIGELKGNRTETAYPSLEINSPPGGAINYTTSPPSGAGLADYFIGSQSIVIDPADRAWVLDTGRVLTSTGTLVPATYGGPKLVGINLNNNTVFKTILFPQTVAYPDSYLNDVRFDLRPDLSGTSGRGIAYITDSSTEGRNGIVMADLGTGESWRHLDGNPTVRPEGEFLAYQWGQPIYFNQPGKPFTYLPFGSDGIALSADGEDLFYKSVASRYLYSIPTKRLRDRSPNSEILAQQSIVNHAQTGVTDGMETDTNNFIYHGNMEQNAVSIFNPANGTDQVFVRDPRINWVDTFSSGADGYLYFTVNQLVFGPLVYPGDDNRQKPYALFRVPLPNNATKPMLV
ncbi:major royal jelly protein [Hortaea werneckii]|uniref:Major royal jelly protein n=1 Tax=Hortaea werneckii TaxID=91943 RepID=A0A3M7HZX9_HORWE|nr:major royal jelly protein [Hortaea werneckii]KAI6874712.1 major royal jelly protein [Hortaea werneckii]KAI7357088.1 major royal jelly protein [Hortaea werneckii]RMZ18748.1 hypothetical protein D0862_00122 [Hortaea werneckii]